MRLKRRPTEIPHIPEHARIAHRFPPPRGGGKTTRAGVSRGVSMVFTPGAQWLADRWAGLSWRVRGNAIGLGIVALVMLFEAAGKKREETPPVIPVAPVERMATGDAPAGLAATNEGFSDVAVVPAQAELAGVFAADDYPSSALRNEQEGTVRARVDVAADGRATGCMVVATSGQASLDEVTCRLLIERGRFTPALNARGEPIASSVAIPPVRWEIP